MALLVFDFDGTLVDSNALKRGAYAESAAGIEGAAAILDRLLAAPARGDRYWIMGELARALGRPEGAGKFVARYDEITREGILARLADGWAAAFLGELRARGHRLYVNSATPGATLAGLLSESGLDAHLAGSRGGFGAKSENLRGILSESKSASATVVGDGEDDLRAAAECGCVFVRVEDGTDALFRRPPAAAADWMESRIAGISDGDKP